MEWKLDRDRENMVYEHGPLQEEVYSLITLQIKAAC